jgi:gliding motility-associated-like protein
MYCLNNNDSAILNVSPTTSIQWFKDDVPISRVVNQTRYKVSASGTYHALLKNDIGCSITTKKQPVVIDVAKPAITYDIEYALSNQPLTLQARQIGETVLWKPGLNLSDVRSFSPSFKGTKEQLYTIDILTKSECLTVDTLMVKIIKSVEIFVPTAFTPNKDGKNDYLRPILIGLKDLHYFRIFNRWGQLLFETKKALPGWDGVYKGITQTTQTVAWVVQGTGIDGTTYAQKGTTVLIR